MQSITISILIATRRSLKKVSWVASDKVYRLSLIAARLIESEIVILRFIYSQPGHRVPRYSTINWAVCVPSSCSHTDVEFSIRHYVDAFTKGTGINIDVRVDEEMCQVFDKNWIENIDQGTMIAM